MSIASKLRDKVSSPVLVRFKCSVGGNDFVYNGGLPYEVPASRAAEFCKLDWCVAITDPDQAAFARQEIAQREAVL